MAAYRMMEVDVDEKLNQLIRTYGFNKIDPRIPFDIAEEYKRRGDLENAHHFYGVVYRDYKPYVPNFVPYAASLVSQGEKPESLQVAQEGLDLAMQQGHDAVAQALRQHIADLE
jgi:hypothetical protein